MARDGPPRGGQHGGGQHGAGTDRTSSTRPGVGTHSAAARRRLAAHIAATKRARHKRLLALLTGTASALVLMTAGSGWLLASYVSDHLARIDAGTTGTTDSGPLNILLAGVDQRSGLTRRQERLLHVGRVSSKNSDTMMLVHIAANHRQVEVISLPRDSWVRIPGHGMNKINAAFGLGGPPLMVKTVERATGLTINDFVEVNFLGFVKIINALGGVDVCLPFAVDDPYSGLHLSAGRHHVNGVRALQFARDRHSFALSDLARIADQQQLISSVIAEAASSGTLANPAKFESFLSAATAAVKVDRQFNIVALADQLRYVRPGDVSFITVPLSNTNYLTPTGESAVRWNASAARALFARIRNDQPLSPRAHHRHHRHPSGGSTVLGSPGTPKTAAQAACRRH
jgi:LCP family protein required for cell wall assembly